MEFAYSVSGSIVEANDFQDWVDGGKPIHRGFKCRCKLLMTVYPGAACPVAASCRHEASADHLFGDFPMLVDAGEVDGTEVEGTRLCG